MSQSNTQEFEELSIGTVAGVQAFFQNAQVQFNAGLEKEVILIEQGNYDYGTALHEVFQKIRGTKNRLVDALKSGDDVTQADADELQGHYDRMLRIITKTKVKQVSVHKSADENKSEKIKESTASNLPVKSSERSKVEIFKPITLENESKEETQPNKRKIETKENLKSATEKKAQVLERTEKKKLIEKTNEQKPNSDFVERPESVKPLKPKTGSLVVTSDTIKKGFSDNDETLRRSIKENTNQKVSKLVVNTDTKAAKSTKTNEVPESVVNENESNKILSAEYKKRIESVIELSKNKYEELHKQYSETDIVQDLLFEEVREGLEQLEIISKKSNLTKKQVDSASELMSHIKYAMESIEEAGRELIQKKRHEVDSVPIVTERVQKALHEKAPSKQKVSFVPSSVTVKEPTVAKRSVPRELQTLPKPKDIYESESLTEKYLKSPKYRRFIAEHYSSPAGFERVLDSIITKFEADTIDQIEKWLGDLPASAFSFIKDMTVSEFYTFAKRPYESVSTELEQENIKYETFVFWRDLTDEMLELVPRGSEMTFGQLFAHWMIEVAMQDVE